MTGSSLLQMFEFTNLLFSLHLSAKLWWQATTAVYKIPFFSSTAVNWGVDTFTRTVVLIPCLHARIAVTAMCYASTFAGGTVPQVFRIIAIACLLDAAAITTCVIVHRDSFKFYAESIDFCNNDFNLLLVSDKTVCDLLSIRTTSVAAVEYDIVRKSTGSGDFGYFDSLWSRHTGGLGQIVRPSRCCGCDNSIRVGQLR